MSLSNTEDELPLIPTSKAADPQFQIPLSAFGALVFENGPLLGDVPAKLKTATFGMQVTIDSHREAATATTFTNRCIRRTVRWCRFDHPQREGCLLRAHRRAREVARARAVRWRRRAAHVRGHVQRRPRERRWRPRDAERQVRSQRVPSVLNRVASDGGPASAAACMNGRKVSQTAREAQNHHEENLEEQEL